MSNFSGNNPSLSDDVNLLPNHNITKFTVECDKIINEINNGEEDPNLPSLIDSNYYDINEFNSCKIDKSSSFGLLHINIASLNKHIDDLKLILSMLTHEIDVIGISEHKIQKVNEKPSVNINIPRYHEFLFQPTETSHGGTGFYLKDHIDYVYDYDYDYAYVDGGVLSKSNYSYVVETTLHEQSTANVSYVEISAHEISQKTTYNNDSSDDDLNTKENDYDDNSIESIKSKNSNDAMQTIDESQVTDITVSTDINCSQSITESIISVNEMELVDRNDYYVSLEDQIKIYRENNRAKFNCDKLDVGNVKISPVIKNDSDITNDTHYWPPHTILIASDSMFQNIDERRLSKKNNFTVKVRSFRGSTVNAMYFYLAPLLRKQPEYVILAVSTNDCTNSPSVKVLEDLLNLKRFIESRNGIKVIISEPITKFDDNALACVRVRYLQEKLRKSNIILLDNSNIVRKHLNDYGTARCAMNIISLIKRL